MCFDCVREYCDYEEIHIRIFFFFLNIKISILLDTIPVILISLSFWTATKENLKNNPNSYCPEKIGWIRR